MKKIFILFLLIFSLSTVYAQKHEEMKDKFLKAQFNEIKISLGLNDSTAKALEPLYINFMNELRPVGEKPNPLFDFDGDEQKIDKHLRSRLAMAKHIAVVREKYYEIFRKVLSPSQIMKMYQTEREIMKKVRNESGLRRGGRERDE